MKKIITPPWWICLSQQQVILTLPFTWIHIELITTFVTHSFFDFFISQTQIQLIILSLIPQQALIKLFIYSYLVFFTSVTAATTHKICYWPIWNRHLQLSLQEKRLEFLSLKSLCLCFNGWAKKLIQKLLDSRLFFFIIQVKLYLAINCHFSLIFILVDVLWWLNYFRRRIFLQLSDIFSFGPYKFGSEIINNLERIILQLVTQQLFLEHINLNFVLYCIKK